MVVRRAASGGHGWASVALLDGLAHPPLSITTLDTDFSRWLPGGKFLFPAVVDGHVDTRSPLWSYVFLVAHPTDRAILRLEQSRFVLSVLRVPGGSTVARVRDQDLAIMLRAYPKPVMRPGMRVAVTLGQYKGLEGSLVAVSGNLAKVSLELRSRTCELVLDRAAVIMLE